MADIALDTDGDILIEDDALVLVEGDDAIVQHLQIRFKFFLGEWFLDTRIGVPYFDEILIKNPDLNRVRGIYRQTILTTPGIASLETFELDLDAATRTLKVTFRARKADGEILEFNEEFIIDQVAGAG